MARGLEGGNRLRCGPGPRCRTRRGRRRALAGLVVLASLSATACGDNDDEPEVVAPGLLDTLDSGDYEPAATLTELAERSDRTAMGTIVDVEEGWRFGDGPDDPEAVRKIELIVEAGELDGPIHVIWPYSSRYEIDAIRDAMPIGAPVVLYLTEFTAHEDEPGWYHLGPDDGHTHWELTTPQAIILADSEAGVAVLGDPSAPFADAPALDAEFDSWLVPTSTEPPNE